MWTLPIYQDLTTDQRLVIDLPLDESHVITGPPGSGKTVMAVYRAQALQKLNEPTMLLMYGKLLSTYTKGAIKSLGVLESTVSTMHAWFPKWFKEVYGELPPMIDKWNFDWHESFEIVGRNPAPEQLRQHVIIDEGQDLPREFYQLLGAISRSATVFADENQMIKSDGGSKIKGICAALGTDSQSNLNCNFRNTRSIAVVSGHFYTGAGSAPVELRESAEDGDQPVLDEHGGINEAIEFLVNFEKAHIAEQIGLLLPYDSIMKSFLNGLKGKTANPVEVYSSNSTVSRLAPSVDFSKPGIKVINWQSAKGLEFDTVALLELQQYKNNESSAESFRMKMYMLTSRAKRELYFMYSGEGEPAIIQTLPLSEGLLDDWR